MFRYGGRLHATSVQVPRRCKTQKSKYFTFGFSVLLRGLVDEVGTIIRQHKGYIYIPNLTEKLV